MVVEIFVGVVQERCKKGDCDSEYARYVKTDVCEHNSKLLK